MPRMKVRISVFLRQLARQCMRYPEPYASAEFLGRWPRMGATVTLAKDVTETKMEYGLEGDADDRRRAQAGA